MPASSTTQTQATANAQASVLGPAAKACSVVGVSADGLTLRSGQMSISQAKCLLRELGAGSTDYLDMSSQSGGSTTTPIASVTWRSDGVATVDLSATASARPRPGVTDSPASQAQLTKADVELTVKIMSKECFGSAGCNVTYQVVLASRKEKLEPGAKYDITYDIKGLKDDQTGTLVLEGDGMYRQREQIGSTKSSKDKLTAVVTDVVKLP